jgi:hypothetical protein
VLPFKQIGNEIARRLRVDGPVRDEERASAGVKECAAEARIGFGTGGGSGRRVAGGQHDPIGIELQG